MFIAATALPLKVVPAIEKVEVLFPTDLTYVSIASTALPLRVVPATENVDLLVPTPST